MQEQTINTVTNKKSCTKKDTRVESQCDNTTWAPDYTNLPSNWPPFIAEKCPAGYQYNKKTNLSSHAGKSFKYCYNVQSCANKWTDNCNIGKVFLS